MAEENKDVQGLQGGAEPSDDSPCNLIVKYLPDSIDEQGLKQLFSQYGEVCNCRLIIDRTTGRSKGYGFVKFMNEKSAEDATKNLNGMAYGNKTLRVNAANPTLQKGGASGMSASSNDQGANVYVAGIPKTFTQDELFQMFSAYGTIAEAKVLVDKSSNQSRGVGFIKFDSYESGNAAIQAMNGVTPDGCAQPLTVKFAKVKAPTNMRGNMGMKMQNVQAGYGPMRPNFGFNQDFQNQPYGMPYQQNMMGMNQGQMGYGFGMGGADPYMMNNMYSQQQQNNGNGNGASDDAGLFVFHLPPSADEQQVFTLFSGYGTVMNVKIIRDNSTQQTKGYGFVSMASTLDAQNAINALNGYQMGGKYLKVSFKKKK